MSILSGMKNQEITTIYSVALDVYGRKTKTTVYSNVPCRWQEKFVTVLDKDGKETVAKVQVWIEDEISDTTAVINVGYIFLYDSTEYEVISYINEINLAGEREYIKVFLR